MTNEEYMSALVAEAESEKKKRGKKVVQKVVQMDKLCEKDEPWSTEQLLQQLKKDREAKLAEINEESDSKKPIKILKPLTVAYIIAKHCHFCWFDSGDDERLHLSTYDPEAGIYRDGERQLRQFIFAVEPSFNKSRATDVIYQLNQINGKKDPVDPVSSPRYVPVGNGIVDLEMKQILPYKPDTYVKTKIETPLPTAEYGTGRVLKPVPLVEPMEPVFANADGTTWNFEEWLDSIACGDSEIVELLWQVLHAACNTNKAVKLHKAVFLLGNAAGNNGKGTFQALVQNLVGRHNYGLKKVADFEKRFAMESLVNKSVVIGDDNPANTVIADKSNFNSVITGDPVIVEPKGQTEYPAQIRAMVIQSCNKMPRFSDDGGVYRRLLIVPFNADFNGTKENPAIKNRYLADPRLLQYVLYEALIRKGDFNHYLNTAASAAALNEYEHTNNSVWTFIDDVFVDGDIAPWLKDMDTIPTAYLYQIWCQYAKEYGYQAGSQNTFNEKAVNRLQKVYRQCELQKCWLPKADREIIDNHQNDDFGYVPNKLPGTNKSIKFKKNQ
ncbi:DNA primase family protein [uncultured Limosilactobacillus sp.]|uniref:DNA primase family protein n=1 Tax=uncultured Limosilactobacillus sp. TaxID=2837629 RepID=UPI0024300248|nr:DNA primase family protein [uncultured Limosilactobacillus sp.]